MRDQSQVLKLKLWFKFSNKFPGPDDFKGKIYQTWRVSKYPSETLPKIEEEETLLSLFHRTTITLIPETDKKKKRKLKANITDEHRHKNPPQSISKLSPTIH